MKIAIVLGTRPEIIKFSPIIREWQRLCLDSFIVHTGQHYSFLLDKVFFEQLELPLAKYNLNIGSGDHGEQTAAMLTGIERILKTECPNVVLVLGDTNTVLAGALAAAKLGIKVGHVEAGLRSYDSRMPEEINRVLVDHCSDFLFAPTQKSKQILLQEGIDENKIFTVGNTIFDAVCQNLKIAKSKPRALTSLGVKDDEFMLATVHRAENVDNRSKFSGIIAGLIKVQSSFDVPLVFPIHPRAKKQLDVFNLDVNGITLVDPLDYLNFLQLESMAKLVLTDSGGVQEETCILGVPCVTLRENTERPETLDLMSNILAGSDPERILSAAKTSLEKNKRWINPFGDGTAAMKIMSIMKDQTSN